MKGLLVQPRRVVVALLAIALLFAAVAPDAEARAKKPRSAAKVAFKVPAVGKVAVVKFQVTLRAKRVRAPKLKLGKGVPKNVLILAHRVRLKKPKRTFAFTLLIVHRKVGQSASISKSPSVTITVPGGRVKVKVKKVDRLVRDLQALKPAQLGHLCDDLESRKRFIETLDRGNLHQSGIHVIAEALIRTACGQGTANDFRTLEEAGIPAASVPQPGPADKDGDGKADAQDSCVDRAGAAANGCPFQCSTPCEGTTQGAPAGDVIFRTRWNGTITRFVVYPPAGNKWINKLDSSGCTGSIDAATGVYSADCPSSPPNTQHDFSLKGQNQPAAGNKVQIDAFDSQGKVGQQAFEIF
jgi:hypothetical protein